MSGKKYQTNNHFKLGLLVVVCCFLVNNSSGLYTVNVERVNSEKPVISSQYNTTGASTFVYNYNSAYIQLPGKIDALLVRCQNLSDVSNPYSTTPSVITLAQTSSGSATSSIQSISFNSISPSDIVLQPSGEEDNYGTEDPRCVYRSLTQTYYMMYSAVQEYENGTVISRLSCATSKDGKTWVKHGPVFSDGGWSKSGAVLIRSPFPLHDNDENALKEGEKEREEKEREGSSMMFWGDSSLVAGIQIAYPLDETLLHWQSLSNVWLPVRNESYFDSYLVEAGPQPMLLSDGNYLFLYNSARCCYNSSKPGYDLQYNVGWVILNGTNPEMIIQRAEVPLLSPELVWELGYPSPPQLGNTPNVVFVEGIQQYAPDQFLIYYGAADSVVGSALVTVSSS